MAETLNNFFTSLGRTEQSTSGAKLNPDVSRIQQNLTPKPLLSLRKTNSAKVKEAMIKIKAKKATGRDRIPLRAVKESAEILCHPFSELFNYILDKSKLPQRWKLRSLTSFQEGLLLDQG